MYPHERSLVKQLADKPFAIVGINSDEDAEATVKVCEEKNLTWQSFKNEQPDGTVISDDWNVKGWPTIYLLDAEGKIRHKNVRGKKLDVAIVELLGEMGHDVELGEHEEE